MRVTAEPGDDTLGQCTVDPADLLAGAGYGEEGERWVRAHLIVTAAGAASESAVVDWDAPHLGRDRASMQLAATLRSGIGGG